jgi:hypothetical protein
MDEWETKIEKLAQLTINENVTSISGVPTWTNGSFSSHIGTHR